MIAPPKGGVGFYVSKNVFVASDGVRMSPSTNIRPLYPPPGANSHGDIMLRLAFFGNKLFDHFTRFVV